MSQKASTVVFLLFLAIAIAVVLLFIVPRISAEVTFDAEKVVLTVTKTDAGFDMLVEGYFFFSNPNSFNVTRPIQFPVPTEVGELDKNSVLVFDGRGSPGGNWEITRGLKQYRSIVLPSGKDFAYRFPFEKKQTTIMACRYIQHLEKNEVTYIVTTIQSWGKPLKEARFEIVLPENYILTSPSFDFKPVSQDESGVFPIVNTWRYDVTDFYPETDIKAGFELKPPPPPEPQEPTEKQPTRKHR